MHKENLRNFIMVLLIFCEFDPFIPWVLIMFSSHSRLNSFQIHPYLYLIPTSYILFLK